jgi:hypothetical protein
MDSLGRFPLLFLAAEVGCDVGYSSDEEWSSVDELG